MRRSGTRITRDMNNAATEALKLSSEETYPVNREKRSATDREGKRKTEETSTSNSGNSGKNLDSTRTRSTI